MQLGDSRRFHLHPGDFFGEMALISGQPRSADVTATDYTKLLALDQSDYRKFTRKYPEIGAQVTALAAQRQELNRKSEAEKAPPAEAGA